MRLISTKIILFSGHPGALWLVWGSENEHHRGFFPNVHLHLYLMALTRLVTTKKLSQIGTYSRLSISAWTL